MGKQKNVTPVLRRSFIPTGDEPRKTGLDKKKNAAHQLARRSVPILIVAIFAAYLAALIYARDRIPAGLHNDVAEEALRGLYLVEGRHFEVMTFSVGNSAETLYLYLVGVAAQLLGPTTLAIQLPSWAFALACIWLV